MLKKLNSIRITFIKDHLNTVLTSTIITLGIFLLIKFGIHPDWLNTQMIFLFSGVSFFVASCIAIYSGYQSSSYIKERLDSISNFLSALSRGKYETRVVHLHEKDEVARLIDNMNELAQKMQSQVRSLQRMADQKSDFARVAHKAATIEERQRLARDLHDAVSQQLFAMTMMSQATLKIYDQDPTRARKQLEEITRMALQAQTEMRALLLHLRPVHLSGVPLSEGVHNLIKELKQRCQIKFMVNLEDVKGLSKAAEEHLFRMVQEALSNILRHADATEVKLEMKKIDKELILRISDNGKGFQVEQDLSKQTSYGLKTMKERCEEIGGSIGVRSKQGEGTHIEFRIPLQEGEGNE